jgi:hypothetical protein
MPFQGIHSSHQANSAHYHIRHNLVVEYSLIEKFPAGKE